MIAYLSYYLRCSRRKSSLGDVEARDRFQPSDIVLHFPHSGNIPMRFAGCLLSQIGIKSFIRFGLLFDRKSPWVPERDRYGQ